MNYGLYLSASGVLTNMYRQDVFANNLANVNTVGFKRDLASLTSRDPESVEDDLGFDLRSDLLDALGGGVFAGPQRIDLSPGALERTGNPLDLALDGENAFFTVGVTNPGTGALETRLTRDGRFLRNEQGQLVTAVTGYPVLNAENQPITLPAGETTIDKRGIVSVNGEPLAQVRVASVPDPSMLLKRGENLLAYAGRGNLQSIANPSIHPGYLEQSTADPIKSLMSMISATKAVSGNGSMMRYHDTLLDRAVNTFGRVG